MKVEILLIFGLYSRMYHIQNYNGIKNYFNNILMDK